MDRHVKTLGLLNMVFGAVGFVGSLAALIAAGGFAGISAGFNEDVYGFIANASVVFHLLIAIPCFIGGFFVRKLQDWARVFLIVVSAVNVLNAPFGTLLGVYGLWVLLLPETEPLFENAPTPVRRRPAASAAAAHAASLQAKKADGADGSSTSIVPSTPK
jgi:hypothetical protein